MIKKAKNSGIAIFELDLAEGVLEIQFYPAGDLWRVSIRIEPADHQFNNFTTRQAAVAFFKSAVAEALAKL